MTQKYGEIKGCPIYLLDKATEKLAPVGYVCIQSLITGETAMVKFQEIQNITTVYPL